MSNDNKNNKQDMRGFLIANQHKNTPTHPDLTGTITINGQEFRLAAWKQTAASGKEYLSVAATVQTQNNQTSQNKTSTESTANTPADNSHDKSSQLAGSSNNNELQDEALAELLNSLSSDDQEDTPFN